MRRSLLACAIVVANVACAFAGVVPVSQDVTVNAANPDSNLNTITTRGGLLSGLDDTGSDYSFFLQFNLTGLEAATIDAAKLIGTYTDDFGPVDSFHQIYFIPDDAWSETTMTWNTRPTDREATAAAFDATGQTPGTTIEFDLTPEVKREAAGDGTLSLAFSTIDGRFEDLEFFASKEFNPAQAFRIETTDVAAIPLPPALLPGLVLLASSAISLSLRRRRA